MIKTTLVACLLFATHLIYSQIGEPTAVDPTPISSLTNSELADVQLVVDETAGQQANPADNVADRASTADFSNLFGTVDYGTDGPGSLVFGLSITNEIDSPMDGLASGLFAINASAINGKGDEILLFNNAGVIEGRVGSDVYFTVSNTDSVITVYQLASFNIWNPDTFDHNDMVSLTGRSDGSATVTYRINLVQTITDGDGDSDSAVLNLTEANASGGGAEYVFNFKDDGPALTTNTITAVVEEEQLAGGNEDTTDANGLDTDETASQVTDVVTGSLASLVDSGADGYGGFSLDLSDPISFIQSLGLTSNGIAINDATLSNGVLTAKAGANDIFSLELVSSGDYIFTLIDQLDHHPISSADNLEDILTIDFSNAIKFTDGDGDSVNLNSGMFQIKVIDDIPVDFDDFICTEGAPTNNVVLVIDRSGSMGNDSGVNDPNGSGNYTRMEALQISIEELLITYEGLATLNVKIVSFAGNSQYHGWFSDNGGISATDNAMDIIDLFTPSGSSDYDDALQLTIENYTNDPPPSSADNTTLYFFSDGNPNTDANKQATLDFESTWESFLNNAGSDITNSYAVGIGTGIPTTDYLDVVSYGNSDTITDPTNPRFRGEDNTIIVEDFSELSFVLNSTIQGSMGNMANGNVIDGSLNASGIADTYGADGAGQIIAFEHDGILYNAAINGLPQTITTANGGAFTFYFEDDLANLAGDFEYTASIGPAADLTEVFTYTIQDADGDTTSANLDICVDHETLAIEDVSFSDINYYPNPVLDILYINNINTITKTIFYDINGKKLLEEIHQSDNVELKVDKFKIGVYFLEVYSNNQTETLKIIKGE